MKTSKNGLAALFLTALLACAPARAQQAAPDAGDAKPGGDTAGQSNTDLAKKLQNPIGDLYSFPFQSNTNFGYGPHGGTQEILNIQPVIPIHVTADWNIITRTILPLVWNPTCRPLPTVPSGTAPTTFSAFLSPSNPTNGWLWGVGPVIQIPTISSTTLGSSVWGGGPTAVLVYMNGPFVAGALANIVWSFGGTHGRPAATSYNDFLISPSSTTISATAGMSARPPSSPPTGRRTGRNGPCRSGRMQAGCSRSAS